VRERTQALCRTFSFNLAGTEIEKVTS